MRDTVQVGIASDTHGFFDPKLIDLFEGSAFILHAGDVCGQSVLDQLQSIAAVVAICGNCDVAPLSIRLPPWRSETIGDHRILILHNLGKPEQMSAAASALVQEQQPNIVVSGHSHQGRIVVRDGILFFNPGSAGRKRFKLLRSAGLLWLTANAVRAELYSLESSTPTRVAEGSWRRTTPAHHASKQQPSRHPPQ